MQLTNFEPRQQQTLADIHRPEFHHPPEAAIVIKPIRVRLVENETVKACRDLATAELAVFDGKCDELELFMDPHGHRQASRSIIEEQTNAKGLLEALAMSAQAH